MNKQGQPIKDCKSEINEFSDIKDPYKMEEVFMSKDAAPGYPTLAVRIRKDAAVEVYSGGSMEVHTEDKAVNITNFLNRGFLPCKKEVYDRITTKAALEINALV